VLSLKGVKMQEVVDVLVRARALIADEKYWCRGNYTQLVDDESVFAYCAVGAEMNATRGLMGWPDESPSLVALINALPAGYTRVSVFNDDPKTTHADVLSLYDRAIEMERNRL
jgi:hypothetical protein